MTQINLLPWREQKRTQEKKIFIILLLACVTTVGAIVFLVNCYTSDLVSNQITRNQMLRQEIMIYDAQIKEIKHLEKVRGILISRISIVRNLQSMRVLIVHLLDELIKVTPAGIYLTHIEGKNNQITLTGFSQSNTFVLQEMKNIEKSDWIRNPILNEIKKRNDKNQREDNEFKLMFILESKHSVENV
ncbi:MAG: PilN domain-containing protein [Legionella sp.]|uniref:PilN domain-containing protein n=1 Tax=Legionella sp. TaxID=459 RepID=UPI0039E2F9A6